MKAEINNENKAKFFALYWFQNVLHSDLWGPQGLVYSCNMTTNNIESNDFLLLKPLSQIVDEHVDSVLEILFGNDIDKYNRDHWRKLVSSNLRNQFGSNIFPMIQPYFSISWSVCDYLRSKGYALPWMGLSVDEMINAGWIKLTE